MILASAIDTWATLGVAVGTIATVVYALFRDVVVVPRRRPKLELRFDRSGNDQVILATADGSDAAYVRLRIANRKGKDTADDVVLMVTELRRLDDSGTPDVTTPIGLPLTWSGTSPPLTVASVHPGSADAARFVVPVSWDGKWSADEAIWDHLRVEPPRETR